MSKKAHRVEIYLQPEERKVWDRTLKMSKKHESLSSMVRDLVQRHYRQLKRKGKRG